ncbi:hypothetical protein NDU88_006523 [Pleurodeles waltl]|uniref:Uncharacterized protein n=1 Tax=Pleurodeles waltl TaxID=8319 RepID=A0AAV7WB17_PLEWA|nr:hypothetical protein NDU88_006523 [Pleurodeles waltl]
MTYDAEGVIKRKREDGREERSEEKEEPRTRRSRGEETTITQEPEEERENTVAGEQSTKGEPAINQELKGEEDTASKVIETEGGTRNGVGAGRAALGRRSFGLPDSLVTVRASGTSFCSFPIALYVKVSSLPATQLKINTALKLLLLGLRRRPGECCIREQSALYFYSLCGSRTRGAGGSDFHRNLRLNSAQSAFRAICALRNARRGK